MHQQAFRLLGISKEMILWIKESEDYPEALERLNFLKSVSRTNFRQAAKVLHPDVTNGDPKKTELFRLVTELNNEVQATGVDMAPSQEVVIPLGPDLFLHVDPETAEADVCSIWE